jgi:copper(I)-binding protein
VRRFAPATVVLAGAVALAGCTSGGSEAEVSVTGAYMPQPVSDSMAAGYLTVTNEGGTKDELTSVTSDVGEVTAHETVGGSMQQVEDLAVPAHGQLVFKSGGNHLMFDKLKRKPKQGETVTVKLRFAESGTVTVQMPVKPATYTPTTGH